MFAQMPWDNSAAAGGSVPQLDLDLLDPQSRPQDVNGHTHFHTPAGGQRTGQFEGPPGQAALTGQRGPWCPAGELGDATGGGAHHQPEASRRGSLVGDLGRQHQGGQDQHERGLAAPPAQPGQGVGDRDAGQHSEPRIDGRATGDCKDDRTRSEYD